MQTVYCLFQTLKDWQTLLEIYSDIDGAINARNAKENAELNPKISYQIKSWKVK